MWLEHFGGACESSGEGCIVAEPLGRDHIDLKYELALSHRTAPFCCYNNLNQQAIIC